MLIDHHAVLSDYQDLAKAVGSYTSDKSLPRGNVLTDVNGGAPIADLGRSVVPLLVQVTETFTSGGAGTLQAHLIQADDAALTTNVEILQSTAVVPLATLAAGYQMRLGGTLPVGLSKAHLGIRYDIGTATMTAGKVFAGIVLDKQTNPTV